MEHWAAVFLDIAVFTKWLFPRFLYMFTGLLLAVRNDPKENKTALNIACFTCLVIATGIESWKWP